MKTQSSTHEKLSTDLLPLLEFSNIVNSSLDLPFVLNTLLLTIMGKLLITKGVVLLRSASAQFTVQCGKGIPPEFIGKEFSFHGEKENFIAEGELRSCGITKLLAIVAHEKIAGYVGIGERTQLTTDQEQFISTLINISAAAIEKGLTIDQLKKVNRDLDGKIHQLDTLFESAKEFSGILDEERLIKLFSLTLMGHIGTNRYALCLKNGKNITSKISSEHLDEYKNILFELISEPVLLTEELLNSVFLKVRPCLTAEKIRAVIPLQIQNEVQGVLCVGERLREGDYSQEELEFLYSLASFAILSLENARLFKEAIEKQRLENELLIAREIQQNLLPRHIPEIKNFEIAAVNVSSKQVGGDYYDIIPLHNSQFVLAIGDVAGKGTPASLLMANAQATLRTLVPFQLSLPETTARINDIIFENTTPDKFITFFLGLLNSETKEFSYVNAGHNPPFVLRANGSIERLTEGGIILGIMKAMIPYKEGKIILEQGDSVILFTDGVSEAMNSNGEEYTEEKLEEIIRGFRHYSAGKILSSITHEITSYTIGAPQSDDITLMVFTAL